MNDVTMRVRGRVARDLERVSSWVSALRNETRPQELESEGDNTPLSEAADAAQVVEERELSTQLLDWLVGRSIELRGALHRIDEGTYGVCEDCDEYIHPERLHALPEATRCLDCQRLLEKEQPAKHGASPGWIEAIESTLTRVEAD